MVSEKISIIVPVYNVEPYLRRCVQSILDQTFSDFQLILVDDGSPDGCPAICDEYAAKDSRVIVIHQRNGGLSAARNTGIDWVFAHSDSQWLTFVDSDDWLHPGMLDALLLAASKGKARVSVCGYLEAAAASAAVPQAELHSRLQTPETFYCDHHVNAVVAWGKLYHRTCFDQIRYPVGKLHEDEFVTHRILFEQEQIAVVPAPLYYYFVNTAGISKSRWNPARLHGLEALEEQLIWFRKRGFRSALRACIQTYIGSIVQHRQHVLDAAIPEAQRRDYLKLLEKKLRRTLVRYGNAYPIAQHCWVYETAFPCGMQVYWLVTAAKKKIRKMLLRK